jgi:hypothetical protein
MELQKVFLSKQKQVHIQGHSVWNFKKFFHQSKNKFTYRVTPYGTSKSFSIKAKTSSHTGSLRMELQKVFQSKQTPDSNRIKPVGEN